MTREKARELVMAAVELFASTPDISDELASEALAALGFSDRDSALAVALVPTVFGRLVLRKLGDVTFSPFFSAKDAKGQWIQYWLRSQPVYRAAVAVAVATEVHGLLSSHQFRATATRSAELKAASQVLDSGADLGGAFSEIALIGPSAEVIGRQGRVKWWEKLLRGA